MSPVTSPPERWKAQTATLSFAVLLSLLCHVLGASLFSARAVIDNQPILRPPLVTFLPPDAPEPQLHAFRERIALLDPSVSSLPNPRGFSGTVIGRGAEVPSLIETRQDNPQLLAHRPFEIAQLALIASPSLAASLAERAHKQSAFELEEEPETVVIQRTSESGYFLSPSLQKRKLLSLASIPLVRFPAPAQPTVVRVCISPIGDVKFAVIEKGSGADDKDARALDIVRRWRFESAAPGAGDLWGTVSVYWAAETPAPPAPVPVETNAPSVPTP